MESLLITILAVHLLAMNVASASPLVALYFEWRERKGDSLASAAANYLGWCSLAGLIGGGLLGLLMGTLLWTNDYQRLWTETLRNKASWAIAEYVFSLVLLSGYLFWRGRRIQGESSIAFGFRGLILFLCGTNLLYHFPFLFSVATEIANTSEHVPPLDGGDFRQWMIHPDVLARVVHIVLASFAVSGIAIMGLAMRTLRQDETNAGAIGLARTGAWIALVPSLAQIPTGLWLIASLPPNWQNNVLGNDVFCVGMLGISVLAALWMMQDLAQIAFGEVQRKSMLRCMILMVVVVLLMTGVLRRMRHGSDIKPVGLSRSIHLQLSHSQLSHLPRSHAHVDRSHHDSR